MTCPPGVLIGVDVGGTAISGGLVTPDGAVLSALERPTHAGGAGSALDTLLAIVRELVGRAGQRQVPVAGIGVGLPGIVDPDAGVLSRGIGWLPELAEIPLAEHIELGTGVPALLDNDVNAQALGEWIWGHGRGARSLAVLALGTGVGGALILDGRLVRGERGFAGEFGHVSVDLDGRRCICGARGCLAAYAAGIGIATEAARRARGASEPAPAGPVPVGERVHDAEPVFRAAARGDAVARAVIEEACQALGAALGGLVNGVNPGVIVVTGGVVKSLVSMEREILRWTAEYALAPALAGTRIHLVPAHKDQTVRGGAALVLYEEARRAAHS